MLAAPYACRDKPRLPFVISIWESVIGCISQIPILILSANVFPLHCARILRNRSIVATFVSEVESISGK